MWFIMSVLIVSILLPYIWYYCNVYDVTSLHCHFQDVMRTQGRRISACLVTRELGWGTRSELERCQSSRPDAQCCYWRVLLLVGARRGSIYIWSLMPDQDLFANQLRCCCYFCASDDKVFIFWTLSLSTCRIELKCGCFYLQKYKILFILSCYDTFTQGELQWV